MFIKNEQPTIYKNNSGIRGEFKTSNINKNKYKAEKISTSKSATILILDR